LPKSHETLAYDGSGKATLSILSNKLPCNAFLSEGVNFIAKNSIRKIAAKERGMVPSDGGRLQYLPHLEAGII